MISVDGLVATRRLGLSYLAGAEGGARVVTWAHVCDLPDPWRWCKPGQIVMTTGGGLPEEEADQAKWIETLIDSGVSALVLAPRPDAPTVLPGLTQTADRAGFPVLAASFNLEFVTLARVVIESAIEAERERLATTKRVYDLYLTALRTCDDLSDRLATIGRGLGWSLELVLGERGEGHECASSLGSIDAFGGDRGTGIIELEITSRRPAYLRATRTRTVSHDPGLLQHVAGIAALELEQEALVRDRQRESGANTLRALMEGQFTLASVFPEMRERGLADPIVLACWISSDDPMQHEDIHHHAAVGAMSPYIAVTPEGLFAIIQDRADLLVTLADHISTACVVGVSMPLAPSANVTDAVRQASLAARRALESRTRYCSYGEIRRQGSLLPRSIAETEDLVDRILGPLLEYDAKHGTDLMGTARTFLTNDRAWRPTAVTLNIHRQTLVYRLRKVEALTGLKPTSTIGTTALWQAFQAMDILNGQWPTRAPLGRPAVVPASDQVG